jgi:hypothetical protein
LGCPVDPLVCGLAAKVIAVEARSKERHAASGIARCFIVLLLLQSAVDDRPHQVSNPSHLQPSNSIRY